MDDYSTKVSRLLSINSTTLVLYHIPRMNRCERQRERERLMNTRKKTNDTIKYLIKYDKISYNRSNYSITDFSGFIDLNKALTILIRRIINLHNLLGVVRFISSSGRSLLSSLITITSYCFFFLIINLNHARPFIIFFFNLKKNN